MGTKTFNNYEDLLTFTRASKGHALRPVSYGSELVTNGTFDSDTSGWTAGNNAVLSVSSNRLRVGLNVTDFAYASQSFATEAGKIYLITFNSWGSNQPALWRLGTSLTSNNVYQSVGKSDDNFSWHLAFVAQSDTTFLTLYANSTSDTGYAEYDNVSVKEVTFDESDGTLTLFEHPDNVPRVEWDADRNRLGLLVEEARTNDILYSEDFDTVWQKPFSGTGTEPVVTTDYAPAPYSANGRASRLQANKTGGAGYSLLQVAPSGSYTGDSTASIWVKSNTGANQTVYFRAGSIGAVEKTVTTEWTRIETTVTLSAGQIYFSIGNRDNTGSENIDILIWGAQLEKNGFASSYIKTTSSSATRSADVASIPVADFGYNQSAGTMLIDYLYQSLGSGELGRYLELGGSNPSQDRILLYLSESSENTALQIRTTGGGTQTGLNVSTPIGQFNKVAGGFSKDDVAAVANGGSAVTDTAADIPNNIVELDIGASSSNIADVGVVYIKSIKYYPRRLTNAQLQDITS